MRRDGKGGTRRGSGSSQHGGLDPPNSKYMLPWAHSSPQPKRHLNRFSHFCTAHGRVSLGMPWHVLSPQIVPSHGRSGHHLIHGFLGPSDPQPKRHLDWFSHFAQLTAERPIYFTAFPSKLPHSMEESGSPSNRTFLGLP